MKASEMTNEELANFFDELSSFNRDDDKFREAAARLRNCEIPKISRDKEEEGHAPKTNEQKYKTAEERIKAFDEWCSSNCSSCPVGDKDNNVYHCMAYWLALEEKEKLEPCPFCGGDCSLGKDNGDHLGNHEYWVDCEEQGCYYRSGNAQSASDAIAAHNRMARAAISAEKAR